MPPGLSLGLSGQARTAAIDTVEPLRTGGVDLAGQVGRFRLQPEAYGRTGTGSLEQGGYAQLSAAVVPQRLELGLRADHLEQLVETTDRLQALVIGYADGNHARASLEVDLDSTFGGSWSPTAALQVQVWM